MAGASVPINQKSGTTKFSDNNECQLQCIKDIFDGFQEDCETFLQKFVDKKNITFKCFKEVWMEQSFWELFTSEHFSNLLNYTTYLYNIINKFIIYSESNYIQIGALYLMYIIHRLKYFGADAKIRITTDQFLNLKSFIDKFMSYGIHDIGFAFNYLRLSGAYLIVADLRVFGLENKYTLSSYSIQNNIFKRKHTLEDISFNIFEHNKEFNLKNLERIDQEFEEYLEKFSLSPQFKGIPMMEKSTIIDTMKEQLQIMKEILSEEVKDDIDDPGKKVKEKPKSEKYTMNPINYSQLNENLLNIKQEAKQ